MSGSNEGGAIPRRRQVARPRVARCPRPSRSGSGDPSDWGLSSSPLSMLGSSLLTSSLLASSLFFLADADASARGLRTLGGGGGGDSCN